MAIRIISSQIFASAIRNFSAKQSSVSINRNFLTCQSILCEKFAIKTGINSIHKQKDSEVEDVVLYPQNDPDTFGKWVGSDAERDIDEDDKKEEDFIENIPKRSQKRPMREYAALIKEHVRYNRIKEAIDVLEVRMLKEDRVKPEYYIFSILITACAKTGYSKKAFQLYNKMKQRGLKITPSIYTSLFNACATAPWSQDGLNKANRLREIMLEKGYQPNAMNYNAMIKAYGRCGDINTAFLIADEMLEKKIPVNVDTLNFLLQACASNKDYGFRHALLVWHKIRRRGLTPDIYSFNNLLRCVRDCSVGDLETLEEVLKVILEPTKTLPLLSDPSKVPLISDNDTPAENYNPFSSVEVSAVTEETSEVDSSPNLLSVKPHLGSLVAISEIKNPEDRLLLIGGQKGFLNEMHKAKVTPGIETFTALLEVIPSTNAAEKHILSMIRKIGLKADIDFFNILIKKRSMRFDYESAKEVLSMIKTAKLEPDIVTYGVLALGCRTVEEARELLYQMKERGIRMNIQILGAMLRQGTSQNNFQYIFEILQISLDESIRPNEQFLRHLHVFQKHCFKLLDNNHPTARTKQFKQNFGTFKKNLTKWQKEFEIENLKLEDAIKKIQEKPYNQFKEKDRGGYEAIKNEKLQRKQKVRKFIKNIKLKDLKDDKSEKEIDVV